MNLRLNLLNFLTRRLVKARRHQLTPQKARRLIARLALFFPGRRGAGRREDLGGVPCFWVEPRIPSDGRVVLYIHGGGYFCCSPRTHLGITRRLARFSGARLCCPDYSLAPEHPFPTALEECVRVYRALLEAGNSPAKIGLAGDSAGGGLAFALAVRLRGERLPLPAAIVGLCPWVDLSLSGASLLENAEADPMLHPDILGRVARWYFAATPANYPLVSPLFAQLHGLPPCLLQAGSIEVLRDDTLRMADHLRAAGVAVDCRIWPGLPHVWHFTAPWLPQAGLALREAGEFLAQRLR